MTEVSYVDMWFLQITLFIEPHGKEGRMATPIHLYTHTSTNIREMKTNEKFTERQILSQQK